MISTEIRKYVRLEPFIKKYCPHISNIKHKLRGVDGNKKAIDFSEQETKDILKELKGILK